MRGELQENVVALDSAKSLANKIKEISNDDASITGDLNEKLEKVEPVLLELVSELDTLQAELQKAFIQSQELNESVEHLDSWLVAAENRLNLQGPVSCRHRLILDQQDKVQVSFKVFPSKMLVITSGFQNVLQYLLPYFRAYMYTVTRPLCNDSDTDLLSFGLSSQLILSVDSLWRSYEAQNIGIGG